MNAQNENGIAERSDWRYFCALPNLSPSLSQSFEGVDIAIVGASDPRLQRIVSSRENVASISIHNSFENFRGKAFLPSVLLFHNQWKREQRISGAIRAFRNIAAIATVTYCRSRAIANDGQWEAIYSDFFDFHHLTPSMDEQHVVTLDTPIRGMGEPEKLHLQPAGWLSDPRSFSVYYDLRFWQLLAAAWEEKYRNENMEPPLDRLFRSLDVAFHAARFPSDGLEGMHDPGIRLGLWVSAIEILMHPGTRVGFEEVNNALGKISWQDSILNVQSYSISINGAQKPANLIQRLYWKLYQARNAFFHGNPVTDRDLYFGVQCYAGSLEMNSILVYGALLKTKLDTLLPRLRPSQSAESTGEKIAFLKDLECTRTIERGLLAVAKNRRRFEETR